MQANDTSRYHISPRKQKIHKRFDIISRGELGMDDDNRKADRRVKTFHPREEIALGSDDSMDHWLREMDQSDADMPRAQEDLLTHLIEDHGYGSLIHPMLKAKYDKKKKLRANSPR